MALARPVEMDLDRDAHDPASLGELLSETRILLPGRQVFLGFLTTLPFTDRFGSLSPELRRIYVWTFVATLLASVLFSAPACYHRLARPIHHKRRFKALANALVVAGMLPLSASVVLVSYLVTSVVVPLLARGVAAGIGVIVLLLWWALPAVRLHDRVRKVHGADVPRDSREPQARAEAHPRSTPPSPERTRATGGA